MNKTTDELLKILISKGDMQKYIEENSNEFLKFSLCQYLNQLLTEHGLKKGKIIADALVERSYGYQIFSGRKDMPSCAIRLNKYSTLHEICHLLA